MSSSSPNWRACGTDGRPPTLLTGVDRVQHGATRTQVVPRKVRRENLKHGRVAQTKYGVR